MIGITNQIGLLYIKFYLPQHVGNTSILYKDIDKSLGLQKKIQEHVEEIIRYFLLLFRHKGRRPFLVNDIKCNKT